MNPFVRRVFGAGLPLIEGIEAVVDRFADGRRAEGDGPPIRNILLWSMDRIGDVVRSTPAIRMLRNRYPDAAITAVVAGRSAPVLADSPHVDSVRVVADPYSTRAHWNVVRALRRSDWDLGVLLEVDPNWEKLGQIAFRLLRVRRMVAFDLGGGSPPWATAVPLVEGRSWTDQFIRLAERVGAQDDRQGLEFHITPEGREDAVMRLATQGIDARRPFLLIHPGGNFLTVSRQWPEASFARLITLIGERWAHPVAITGIGAERPLAERIRSLTATPVIDLCGQLDLRQLAAAIDLCALLITNDTGPLHIAHARRKPAVVILGPTAPAVVGIPPSTVIVRKDLPCSPCAFLHGWKACSNVNQWECLSAIAPEDVMAAVAGLLAAGSM